MYPKSVAGTATGPPAGAQISSDTSGSLAVHVFPRRLSSPKDPALLKILQNSELSDPRNRNHKSLAIANHNFEVASFPRRNRSEIAVL